MAKHTFGNMPSKMPEGFAKAVHFPILMVMDKTTGDHRHFESKGGKFRENMPHTIKTQMATDYGHTGALVSGALFQGTLDDETGIVSGDGFLLDDPIGLATVRYVATGAMKKNSVDLADVKAQFVDDMDTGDYWINFSEWAIAATTFVGTPAFGEAYGEIVASFKPDGDNTELMASLMQDEIIASALVDPMTPIVAELSEHGSFILGGERLDVEIVADGLPRVPHDSFFIPESATPHKIKTDGEKLWGHLGKWNTCHEGLPSCVMIPRPPDGYASFNQPGALTDKGQIPTGPIFALGGHRTLLGKVTPAEEAAAYGGIENCWADVRVIEGIHGPWLSGHIRPGVDPNVAYAAVASRISGHWKGQKLKAIVSVNAAGFDVEGDGEMAAAYFSIADDGEVELVASFCGDDTPVAQHVAPAALNEIVAAVIAKMAEAEPAPEPTTVQSSLDDVTMATLALLLEDD